jgi:hypothetical protein
MISTEAQEKIRAFVGKSYASAIVRLNSEYDAKVANLQEQLGMKGLSHSSVMDRELARLNAERVRALIQARADPAIEAYEMYGKLDQEAAESIISDVAELHATIVASLRGATVQQAHMKLRRTGGDEYAGLLGARNLVREVDRLSTPILNEIACQLERRQHMVARNSESGKTTNVYHVYGHNPHWNLNSVDSSVNTVTLTNDQLFVHLKEEIAAKVTQAEERDTLLGRLEALERAQNTPSFGQRYTEFISTAANHMEIIAPFIPALTEILQKALQ